MARQTEHKPYIGINGASLSDLGNLRTSFSELGLGFDDYLKGIQVSEKTGLYDIENKYGTDWYPVGDNIWRWLNASRFNSAMHINFGSTDKVAVAALALYLLGRQSYVTHESTMLGTNKVGTSYFVNNVQLNRLPWATIDYANELEAILERYKEMGGYLSRIVLQANREVLAEAAPPELATKARRLYADRLITDVLLDPSSGTGRVLDVAEIDPFLAELYEHGIPCGIAGGLNAENVEAVAGALLAEYPYLSVDAETGLRTNYDPKSPKSSQFSVEKAAAFAKKVLELRGDA